MAPPRYSPLADHVEGGSSAKVDHDAWAAVALVCGNGVHKAVGPKLSGVIHQDGHAGLDAGLHKDGLLVEVLFADPAERCFNGRNYGRDDDMVDFIDGDAAHLK
jgi:hypothetical protein